jgi:cytochrome c-type biogenesis protein
MDFANVTLGLAFLAGLASFLSPCVFSLVPAYVGYLGGRAAGGEVPEGGNRWATFTHMIGVYRIPFLEYDTRVQKLPDPKWGYLSSALLGVFFSAGWSPCVGPVLGAILTLALNGGSVSQGASLLSAYSAGLAIPFLVAALGGGWVSTTLRKYGKVMRYVEIGMGVLLVVIGIMLFAGTFERLAQFGLWVDFGL